MEIFKQGKYASASNLGVEFSKNNNLSFIKQGIRSEQNAARNERIG